MDLKAKQEYFGPYALKGLQVMDTPDGYAYHATLTENGAPVARVHQGGFGGPTSIDAHDKGALERLRAFCAAKPPITSYSMTLPVDPEIFLDELQAHVSTLKSLKRKAKGKTLVSLRGDPEDTYRVISVAYTPELKPKLEAKFGADLRCVMNEFL